MKSGLHAVGWGLQRTGIALGMLVLTAAFAYVIWVIVLVVASAAFTWGS